MAFQKPIESKLPSSSRAGFTLVEVALAIGIVAFAFVALLALLPAGHAAYRRAVDMSVCSQIAQRVINDAQQSDFDTLIDQRTLEARGIKDLNYTFRAKNPADATLPPLRYFDEQGREVIPTSASTSLSNAIYVVNTRITPRYQLPKFGIAAPPNTTSPPSEPLALVTIQIAHNPAGRVTLPLSAADASDVTSPERNLWTTANQPAGIEIFTYSSFVGRNL